MGLKPLALIVGFLCSAAALRFHHLTNKTTGPFVINLRNLNTLLLAGLLVGGAVGLIGLALFLPAALIGALTVVGTVILVAILQARVSGRWALVWLVLASGLVWFIASGIAWTVWGVEFDLADTNQAIPTAVSLTMRLTVVIGGIGFVGFVVFGALGIRRARRLAVRRSTAQ